MARKAPMIMRTPTRSMAKYSLNPRSSFLPQKAKGRQLGTIAAMKVTTKKQNPRISRGSSSHQLKGIYKSRRRMMMKKKMKVTRRTRRKRKKWTTLSAKSEQSRRRNTFLTSVTI
jgi:hypothetical protein